MIPPATESLDNCLNGNFICGVVEGFYGKPWTTEERKKLFQRMNKMGMNMYVYAPKDDCKHRIYWRDLYSVEEADHLTSLIDAATESNVTFVYAISPGLDITFSSSKEVTFLKRKLEQVQSFGCKSFALLFDDIEPEMCEADKEIFQSFAHAQVSISNEVFQHLGQPSSFLFCPTEYCASRAVPDVPTSEYLTTIGSKLLPGVDVLWTGPKVVSKKITVQSIEEVTSVLKRPPVIWDNIHANDYDPKRIFLGPYSGRSPELIPYIRGVLTNPNCEFEANFVAMHTLAQWSKSNMDGTKKDVLQPEECPVGPDAKLETDGEYSSDEEVLSQYDTRYQPRQALDVAIKDWLLEFDCLTGTSGKLTLAAAIGHVPCQSLVQTCGAVTPTTPVASAPVAVGTLTSPCLGAIPPTALHNLEVNDSYAQPAIAAHPMNSLVDSSSSDTESDSTVDMGEPMDTLSTPGTSPPTSNLVLPDVVSQNSLNPAETCDLSTCKPPETMQVDVQGAAVVDDPATVVIDSLSDAEKNVDSTVKTKCLMTQEDVSLLVDLFYLPFEYGGTATTIMQEFQWLKSNAYTITDGRRGNAEPEQKEAAKEWKDRAQKFEDLVESFNTMVDHLKDIPNRVLLYNLFPYVWDVRSAISLMLTFIQWLAHGHMPYISVCYLQGNQYTWANKAYRDCFTSGVQEPWVFQGGLQAEMKRMLPVDSAGELLFSPLIPSAPMVKFYHVRPYKPQDEAAIYEICRKTCDDGMDGTEIFPEMPDLIGDRLVGSFLVDSPEMCFVLSDGAQVVGYCLACTNAKTFHKKQEVAWLPAMQEKYAKPQEVEGLTPAEEVINIFYNEQPYLPDSIYSRFPSLLKLNVLPCSYEDYSAPRRLLLAALAALRTNGSCGVHCEVHVGDKNILEAYKRLGFFEIPMANQVLDDIQLLGRII